MSKPTTAELDEARRKYAEALEVFKRDDPDPARRRHGRELGRPLCEALGLDASTVRRLELVLDVEEAATVTVWHCVKTSDAAFAEALDKIATYEVVPRTAPKEQP